MSASKAGWAFQGASAVALPPTVAPPPRQGDDAKMLSTLTNPAIVSTHALPAGWKVAAALEQVAALRPPVHALIDAGALVTGYTNREVAEFLLPRLGQEYGGVVYLDEAHNKTILLRSGATMGLERCGPAPAAQRTAGASPIAHRRTLRPLASPQPDRALAVVRRCGLPKEQRFSFFDQVHTTGMDIPQAAGARAVLTLSKDLVFRDYAQAAYRMR